MSFAYTKGVLKISVAQICQNIGWHAVQTSPLEILIDITHRYILELSKTVHRYSNQYGRTEPNLDDLALTFKDFNISLNEIEDYVNNVEPVPFVHKLGKFPVAHPSNLQHPKPRSREIFHRPEFIPDYLPAINPDLEEEDVFLSPHLLTDSTGKKLLVDSGVGGESPLSSPRQGSKRSAEWNTENSLSKKSRHYTEEEGRPMREVTSVFLTSAGIISPILEGKTADASLPQMESPPSTPEPVLHPVDIPPSRKELKLKDVKKDKGSKIKKDKEINKKEAKKNKAYKKEKENKENADVSSEKCGNPSFSAKKESSGVHRISGKNDKSLKIGESGKQKNKSEKAKMKDGRDDSKKNKDNSKLFKIKTKMNKLVASSSSSVGSSLKHMKAPKPSKSTHKLSYPKASKSPKGMMKSPKSEKPGSITSQPLPPMPQTVVSKEEIIEQPFPKVEVMEERPEIKMEEIYAAAEARYREESPEPRLIIDDSVEAQARQEKESRMAELDMCIDAVISRAKAESKMQVEKSQKAVDEVINEVARGSPVKKQEPKDIYDFTDSSDDSLPPSPEPHNSPIARTPVKKEKPKTPDLPMKTATLEVAKKTKGKDKPKKKSTKEQKSKASALLFMSPKVNKLASPVVKDEKALSPLKLKEEPLSSDECSSCNSPVPCNSFNLPLPPIPQRHLPPAPASQLPLPPPFIPSSSPSVGLTTNPFAQIRPFPCHIQSNPHFPTPPLFVTSPRSDGSSFQTASNLQPLNLAKSESTVPMKNPVESCSSERSKTPSLKIDDVIDSWKTKSEKNDEILEKPKLKDHKKEKKDKEKIERKEKLKKKSKEKKEKDKDKPKEKKDDVREKEKPREKQKMKVEKNLKVEKKSKSKVEKDKKKVKEKDEKTEDDSTVPKMTLKLSSGSGAAKIFIKSTKNSSPPPSSPARELQHTPPPPNIPSPPSPSIITPSSPLPPSPPAPPSPTVPSPTVPIEMPSVPLPLTPVSRATHSRTGRGRGKRAAAHQAVPLARTVITETLGTIVDESGNKIWICPACTRPDDGSPMIGCDECDDWYHWVCVGIVVPPKEEESWYCSRCIAKRQGSNIKRRRKKHRKDK